MKNKSAWLASVLLLASFQATAAIHTISVTWAAPTENADGSALTYLAGYKIYARTAGLSTPRVITVIGPNVLSRAFTVYSSGEWFVSMQAYNKYGKHSVMTPEVRVVK